VFSNFVSIHSAFAELLCAWMAALAALSSIWTDWTADPLRAELRNPGRGSAEDFYY
jgi:hypothetical protein